MLLSPNQLIQFFPSSGPGPEAEKVGFRFGDKGTHTSRTMMSAELDSLFSALPSNSERGQYSTAIIQNNCLEKPTVATRRLTNQRLGELYALDLRVGLFRVLRHLWDVDVEARPQCALLAALARDPLLLVTAQPVLTLPEGAEFQRIPVRDALRNLVGERMNDDVLNKVVRNVASSWTQSGHLKGRTFKIRQNLKARPAALAFALYLGHVAGFHGGELLTSGWVIALDCNQSSVIGVASEAKRLGLIDFRNADGVYEFGLDRLDPGIGKG